MQDRIAIILPVRDGGTGIGRFGRIYRCLQSYYEQTEGLSDIYLLHDEDECHLYHKVSETYPQIINYCIPIGLTLMEKINLHALDIASKYKYVGFIGDDIVFRTPFESVFIESLSSVNHGMAYANDLLRGSKLPTHPFVTSKTILAVGFFGCPAVEHNFFDNYWFEIFHRLENGKYFYFSKIIMEHIHYMAGKDVYDALADKIGNKLKTDSFKYYNYLEVNLQNDLQKIRDYDE